MKDKNGIEICCKNCDDFIPKGKNGRGCTLYEEDCENVFGEKRCIFRASSEALEARIAELQAENKRLLDCLTEHHILHPDVQKGMDRLNALADKREGLKPKCEGLKEQSFTIEEIDLIRNIFRVFVDENERMDGDDKCDAREIIAKCDAILKRESEGK